MKLRPPLLRHNRKEHSLPVGDSNDLQLLAVCFLA